MPPSHAALARQDTGPVAQPRIPALGPAVQALCDQLVQGHRLSATILRDALSNATGGTDATGHWHWKHAYDCAEAALALFLHRHATAMRDQAGRDSNPDPDHTLLRMLSALAALEPPQTRRSAEQLDLQQFSTPLAIAYAVAAAAAARPDDHVLDPSAGTGILPATLPLAGAIPQQLTLNELSPLRTSLLKAVFPAAAVSSHDAETIADRLPIEPTLVVLNPPFSRSPSRTTRVTGIDLSHIESAAALLPPGGRLVAISSIGTIPFAQPLRNPGACPPTLLLTATIPGVAYARHGTTTTTRISVIERTESAAAATHLDASDIPELLTAIRAHVPPRAKPERTVPPPPSTPIFELTAPPAAAPPARRRPPLATSTGHWPEPTPIVLDPPDQPADATVRTDCPYVPWSPTTFRVRNGQPHPNPLVQSAAMAAVRHPDVDYRPLLPRRVVTDGLLSDAQLETVVLAGAAHEQFLDTPVRTRRDWTDAYPADIELDAIQNVPRTADGDEYDLEAPARVRRGWMLGDGTGTGKGREVSGIILDQWLRGRRRAVWLSESDKLVEDARRDWVALGGHEAQVIPVTRFKTSSPIPLQEGILFVTYASLRVAPRNHTVSRLQQIVAWLADGDTEADRHAYDGCIVMDECHALANAAAGKGSRGLKRASAQGIAGLKLQHALPQARVTYVSATGATTLEGLCYALRLGLWGTGDTPFDNRPDFITAMQLGGVAAMEVIARDLKALGRYQARALSYAGVEVDLLRHELTPPQVDIYNRYADAFTVIHQNLRAALEATGIIGDEGCHAPGALSAAYSAFESAKQRFFGHLLTSMKTPTLIQAIEQDLEQGCAPVVQLVSTAQALLERRLDSIPPEEWQDLAIDLTPREYVLDYVRHAFPTTLYEEHTDENGTIHATPAVDNDGRTIECAEAVRRRDELLIELASLPAIPAALDQLIHHFGHDRVAEVTGRSRRILRFTDNGRDRLAAVPRSSAASIAETNAFMDGSKPILVFSMAGGTGRSYHDDKTRPNAARRHHYLHEPGWQAAKAVQGLGRTHRTHQRTAPLFRPVTTNVKGEARFISTIARRLDALGAITRGQRNSQTAMGDSDTRLFRATDNLESPYATAALRTFYQALYDNRIPDWPITRFEEATGLKLTHEEGLREELPPMPKFLNRLLALRIDDQNALFGELETRITGNIEAAIEAGTYEQGVETLIADSFTATACETLHTHAATGSTTDLVTIRRRDRNHPVTAQVAQERAERFPSPEDVPTLVINAQSRHAAVLCAAPSLLLDDGGLAPRITVQRPNARSVMTLQEFHASRWQAATPEHWQATWEHDLSAVPEFTESMFYLATGLLLPVWNHFPQDTMRVRRLVTDDGTTLLGRILREQEVYAVRTAFDCDAADRMPTPAHAFTLVLHDNAVIQLANGLTARRRLHMHHPRVELTGSTAPLAQQLKRLGCTVDIVDWSARYTLPNADVMERITRRWPITAVETRPSA